MFRQNSLRQQLLISHLLLVVLMATVMIGAVASFLNLGRSIDRIFAANYTSVIAAQRMKDALERLDSSAAFVLVGQGARARKQYREHVARFRQAFKIEANNVTEVGETDLVHAIDKQFRSYDASLRKLILAKHPDPTDRATAYYFAELEPAFLGLRSKAQAVLDLNQAAIVRADVKAKRDARRAALQGVVITVIALLVAIYLTLRAVRRAMKPLRSLAQQAEEIGAGNLDQKIDIERSDEIGALAESFNHMARNLHSARQSIEYQLHMAQRMSDDAIRSLYDPIIVADSDGKIAHVNDAAEGLFGSAANMVGKPVEEVIRDRQIARSIREALSDSYQPPADEEQRMVSIHVGDAERTYNPRATAMRDDDNHLLGAVVVLEDVTHLSHLDKLKTEFVSVASHELKTPVTSLLLAAQLLDEGAVGKLNPEQQKVVDAQLDDLDRLNRLILDLLDITRLEAGVTPPRFEIIRPAELVDSATRQVSAQAEAKRIQMKWAVPGDVPSVRADKGQIIRVLLNLLSNALTHTPEGGKIEVGVEAQDKMVAFAIADTGPGIPTEYLARIFERFVQVPGATRGGAGLGLPISQTIIKAHRGEIWATSETGKGSTFRFTLPAA